MSDPVIIAARYNGPPESGNGGYCAGRFAAASGIQSPTVEVTLRRPPPLQTSLAVRVTGEQVGVFAGPDLIAEVRASAADPDPVDPVDWDEAVAVSASYPGLRQHPFPTCFVCGPQRAEGDGLRLFPGRLADGRTATPYRVPAAVTPELSWAALDCPGGWTIPLEGRPYVLGRMAARVDALPAPGDRCVVMGALTGEEGRKAFTLTTLYGPDGAVLARARGTWLAV